MLLLAITDLVGLEQRALLYTLVNPLVVVDEEEEVTTEKLFIPFKDDAI